ncbi:MAG: hypothetical protein ABEI99_07310 [Halobaculum sp.]
MTRFRARGQESGPTTDAQSPNRDEPGVSTDARAVACGAPIDHHTDDLHRPHGKTALGGDER